MLNDDYLQEQSVDGNLKRVDYYVNNEIIAGAYYLSPGEDLQSFLMEIQGTWQNAYIYINEQAIGNYTTRDWLFYIGLK